MSIVASVAGLVGERPAAGARDVVVTDVHGVVHPGRPDLSPQLHRTADNTNPRGVVGTLPQAVIGSGLFVGGSSPNILSADDPATMAPSSVVFAPADPTPEVDPVAASRHAAVVATGRSDFANQINTVLAFPGVFRGLLDARSRTVSTPMLLAAAVERAARDEGFAGHVQRRWRAGQEGAAARRDRA